MARADGGRRLGTPYQLGSIDPGNEEEARKCYVAYWHDSGLVQLEKLNHLDFAKGAAGSRCYACALETPVIYPNEKDPSPPNVIIGVNLAGCLLAGALAGGNVHTYRPKDWKGNRSKPPNHFDIWAELTPRERAIVNAEYKPNAKDPEDVGAYIQRGIDLNSPRFYKKPLRQYSAGVTNYLDAIGVGFKHLGRM